jgi:hypothetical protein
MPKIYPSRRLLSGVRLGLILIASSRLPAEDLTLAVTARVADSCRTSIAAPVLQEAIEGRLQAAGFPLAKAHNASLTADVDCVPVKSRTVIHQCVSLSQAVSLNSEVRTALATTWRQCQSDTCAAKVCESTAITGARSLVDAFVAEQRAKSAREVKAVAGAVATIDRTVATTRASDLNFFFYAFYIMTCFAVLFRWQWTRYGRQ